MLIRLRAWLLRRLETEVCLHWLEDVCVFDLVWDLLQGSSRLGCRGRDMEPRTAEAPEPGAGSARSRGLLRVSRAAVDTRNEKHGLFGGGLFSVLLEILRGHSLEFLGTSSSPSRMHPPVARIPSFPIWPTTNTMAGLSHGRMAIDIDDWQVVAFRSSAGATAVCAADTAV